MKVKDLVYMAMYAALFAVFDYLANTLGLFQMPNGGSLGLAVIPLILSSYHLGWKKGFMVCLVSVALMFVTGPIYAPSLIGFLLDYVFAFTCYGFASVFPNYKFIYFGVLVTSLFRFAFHTISGMVVWETPFLASLSYQATYMIPTTILALVLVPLIVPRLKSLQK